jgi:hypothetical protein
MISVKGYISFILKAKVHVKATMILFKILNVQTEVLHYEVRLRYGR